ncbi:MAG: hypothetical protein QNL62_04750 [Gammaproteobacteria bacterium]|nr:hypothetical protein [Gammaproteobacteria bacterium]
MEDFFRNDEFGLFILNQYFANEDKTNLEKLEQVFSSIEEFSMAMDSFKMRTED